LLISSTLLGDASIIDTKRLKTSLHIPEKIIEGVIDIVQSHKNKPVQGQVQLQAGYQHNQNAFQQSQGSFQGQGSFHHGSETLQQSQGHFQNQGGSQGNFQQNQNQGNFQGQGSFQQSPGAIQQIQSGFHGQGSFQQGQNNLQQNQINYPQNQGNFQQNQGSFQQNQGNFQISQSNYQNQQSYPQYQQQWTPPSNQYQPTHPPQYQQGQFQGQGQVDSGFSQINQISSQAGQSSTSQIGQMSQTPPSVSYPQGTFVSNNGQYQGQGQITPPNQGGGFHVQGQYQESRPQAPISTVSNYKPGQQAPGPTCICQAWTKPQKLTEEATLSKENNVSGEKSVSNSVAKHN
ncbi:hypothetical protein EVAR_80835_1, partial [Eumeta japonica]